LQFAGEPDKGFLRSAINNSVLVHASEIGDDVAKREIDSGENRIGQGLLLRVKLDTSHDAPPWGALGLGQCRCERIGIARLGYFRVMGEKQAKSVSGYA